MRAFTCITNDTILDIKDKELIVSGGRNQYEINFQFDEIWLGLIPYAVFSKENIGAFTQPIVGDNCIIPNDILSEDGEFQFGIFGISEEKSYSSKVYTITVFEGALGLIDTPKAEGITQWEQFILKVEEYLAVTNENAKITTQQAQISTQKSEITSLKAEEALTSANNAKKSELIAVESANNASLSENVSSQAMQDLLAMLGNDVATLVGGKIPVSQIPSLATTEIYTVSSVEEMNELEVQNGDICIRADENKSYIYKEGWVYLASPTDYAERAGTATTAETAINATMINNKRVVSMTQEQYEAAVKDDNTYYFVTLLE